MIFTISGQNRVLFWFSQNLNPHYRFIWINNNIALTLQHEQEPKRADMKIESTDIGSVRLMRGDCLEILPTIADCSCDMALVDLPYGCLNKGNKHAQWDQGAAVGRSMGAMEQRTLSVCYLR